ncbi:hypothetical protein C8R46DRAFT_1033850 [Mycena filopes]|nr:hypothetical protein C8R46DRAFT_1033850 [Mycena filopes]
MAPAGPAAGSPLRFVAYSPSASGVTRKRQRLSAVPSPSPPTPSTHFWALPCSMRRDLNPTFCRASSSDGALLYIKYPTTQLFRYPPFNTVEFRAFAANSVSCIADVEARGRLAVKNLPQNLVRGFQGAISSLTMSQRAARDETQAYMLGLDAKIMALAAQWRDGGGPRRTAGTTRAQRDSEPVFIPPPLLNSSSSPVSTPTPSTSAATFDAEISVPDDAVPSFPSAPLNTQPQQQFSLTPPTIAGAGGFSVSQTAAWNLLALTYTDVGLDRKSNSFLPHYTFQPVPKITDIWTEWAAGLNGYLSVRELNEGWNAKWKHDLQRIKSEYSRRKKVIDLIERLRSKPNWNLELALRFIRETYETPGSQFKTTRSFCDYLQSSKTGGVEATTPLGLPHSDILKGKDAVRVREIRNK